MSKLAPMFEWAAAGRATLGRCGLSRIMWLADGGEYEEMPEDDWDEFSSDKDEELPPAARFDADEGMSPAHFAAYVQYVEFLGSDESSLTAKLLAAFDAKQQKSVCSPQRSEEKKEGEEEEEEEEDDEGEGEADAEAARSLAGRVLCFTGKLDTPRAQAEQLARAGGAQVSKTMTKATNVLVAGAKAGSKVAKAQAAGVEVWSEAEFMAAAAAAV